MENKYRFKLNSGRVIGPFSQIQIKELFVKGHITGSEKCQVFPLGDWISIASDTNLNKYLLSISKNEDKAFVESETIVKVKASQQNQDLNFKEFQYKKGGENVTLNVDDIQEGDYQKPQESQEATINEDSKSLDIEKTVIAKIHPQSLDEKTIVLKRDDIQIDEVKEPSLSRSDISSKQLVEEVSLDFDGKTEVFDLKSVLPILKSEAQEVETKQLMIEEDDVEEVDDEEENTSTGIIEKKKMKPIVAFAFIVLIYMLLFPDDEKANTKAIVPLYPKIIFPVAKEYSNETEAIRFHKEGLKYYAEGDYRNKVKSMIRFIQSLQEKFKDNDAISDLILVYSELFDNSKKPKDAANTIYNLINIAKNRMLTDVKVALGTSLLFSKLGKNHAALRTVENFLRVSKKPNLALYSHYLNVLIDLGHLEKAKKVFEKIKGAPSKAINSYLSEIRFLMLSYDEELLKKKFFDALREFPTSVPILLDYASFLIQQESFDDLKDVLKRIRKLETERSPHYYSKYLEYSGVLAAYKKLYDESILLFKEALALKESDELRYKLSQLEIGGKKYFQKIIKESKIIKLMDKAKSEMAQSNWKKAFKYSLKASDLDLNYKPAQLLLAKIQTERGYFTPAIKTLEILKEKNSIDEIVNASLVKAYLSAFKIYAAKKLLSDLAKSPLAKSAIYAESWGRYFYKIGEKIRALKWLEEASLRNPLNDENYFLMAEILLKERKYKIGKKMLQKAIFLDPTNMKYRSMVANTLYELESADVAIGYLRDILKNNIDNPRILGDIAIYYYKSGQNRQFEAYRKKIQGLVKKDESFYEFMISASKLEEKIDDVIKNAKELIKIKPGDIETRMTLGEFLFRQNYFKDSFIVFESVTERLASFPKANYYKAKIKINQRKFDEAIKFSDEEIKQNPRMEFGYFVKGEVLRLKKDYANSKKMFEKSISINGKFVESLMSLAWIKRRQNFLEPARELYLRALKEQPNNAKIHRELGHIYKDIGQSALAIESYSIYLKLKPAAKDKARIESIIRSLK